MGLLISTALFNLRFVCLVMILGQLGIMISGRWLVKKAGPPPAVYGFKDI
jgi:hypothetical protein